MLSHFRDAPPIVIQQGPTCWAAALASFNRVTLGELSFPEDYMVKYGPFLTANKSLNARYWPDLARHEQLRYQAVAGSKLTPDEVWTLLQGSHLYIGEDNRANMSHAYVVYGIRSGSVPLLAVMNPLKRELEWRGFHEIERSKLIVAYRGIP